jgi:MoxR-like ATPase
VLTTATADWTTYETIGGLKPTSSGGLSFAEGHFLEAIERNQWLVIDELNRSNFDRAFGQLFTVLSGQAVELPYERTSGAGRLVIRPGTSESRVTGDVINVPDSWRVIATMNVFDKSLLFEMSFALMRRFAFVEIPAPEESVFHSLIDREAEPDEQAATLAKRLLVLRRYKDLGPALFMDLARFFRARRELGTVEAAELTFDGFYSFLLPQFEGIDQTLGELLHAELKSLLGLGHAERVRKTLNSVLGLELAAPVSTASTETDGLNGDAEVVENSEDMEA